MKLFQLTMWSQQPKSMCVPATPKRRLPVMKVKLLHTLCLLLLAPGLILAQADPQKPDSSPNNSDLATEVKALREALVQTQKQMAAQQREIEALKEGAK